MCQTCIATASKSSVSSQLSTVSFQIQSQQSSQNATKTLTSAQLPEKMPLDSLNRSLSDYTENEMAIH